MASWPAAAQSTDIFTEVDDIMGALSHITGWRVKNKVKTERLARAEFAKLIEKDVVRSEKDKDTRAVELTLKMFGLVPWDFQLARESADLVEEQTAAFYDYKKKRLVILESEAGQPGSGSEEDQRVALAHELAHALADQQFGLAHYMRGAKDDDASTARQSVVEGQAHWLSWAYMAERATGRAEVPAALLRQLASAGMTGEAYPVLTGTPLYMRESLLFPYTQGMQFQDAVYHKWGQTGFTRVFRDAPLSTQEILHPTEYEDGVSPTMPELPDLRPLLGKETKQWKKLTDGDVGEFDISAILRQNGNQKTGAEIATEWRGGSYGIYEHKKSKELLLVHSSDWSGPEAARGFFRAYLNTLRAKWQHFELKHDEGDVVRGTGDRGDFLLRISGASVQCVEGLPQGWEKAEVSK